MVSHIGDCLRKLFLLLALTLTVASAEAQIVKIGGNVYGGGNEGNVGGGTSVTIHGGDLNRVFGGARMADVGGSAFVHVDGEKASSYIIINQLYGGNDISGHIGKSLAIPDVLTKAGVNGVNQDWSAFVRVSTKTVEDGSGVKEADDAQKIYIGQLFGGGNGNYDYSSESVDDVTYHILNDSETKEEVLRTTTDISQPDLDKTYLELLGGSVVNAFGGGNRANVNENVVIHLDNPSKVVNHIVVDDKGKLLRDDASDGTDLLVEDRFKLMGFNYKFTYPNSGEFQIGNLFGGNNKVDMAIQPKWNLLGGQVRNLYSGGNEGGMTCPQGLVLEIPVNSKIVVDNVYGGCRKADVRPKYANGEDVPNQFIQLANNPGKIPAGFAARTRIYGGTIRNVYGGNDISGNVYGGNTIGLYTSIRGSVYGGGNGSYAYTDNPALKDDLLWRDFYYNPLTVLGLEGTTFTPEQSAEALLKVRPNAEQVSIRVEGKPDMPTVVEGSLFVGGNSASLHQLTSIANRQAHLKIGSYVRADRVYLGNNGEGMIDASDSGVLVKYAGTVTMADGTTEQDFSTLDLTNANLFAKYMEGCAMKVVPSVVFDSMDNGDPTDYIPYTTAFGSFYCGGNVGSMILEGKTTINFDHPVYIYNRFVGGCNDANVPVLYGTVNGTANTQLNAFYEGGFMTPGSSGPTVGDEATPIADKLELNLLGINIQPKRRMTVRDENYVTQKDENGNDLYVRDELGYNVLEWNTIDARTGLEVAPVAALPAANDDGQHISNDDDLNRRLTGGNIYGGCYSSGHIDGNVVINLDGTILDRWTIFDKTEESEGEVKLYDNDTYNIMERNSGVILDEQGMDVLGTALNVFGGGYGRETEIWGSTTINLNAGYTFQIFGGSERGAIGRGTWNQSTKQYDYADTYDSRFSTYVNLNGRVVGAPSTDVEDMNSPMAAAEFLYGGGFQGPVLGDTHIYLGNGRIFNSFAGSCNADIWGHTETYVGLNANGDLGFPWVRDHIYGGNDLGGTIRGEKDFSDQLSSYMKSTVTETDPETGERTLTALKSKMHGGTSGNQYCTTASAYTEYRRGRVEYIFGGCYGDYDYTDRLYEEFTNDDGTDKEGFSKPRLNNAFVNFRPEDYVDNSVQRVYGAGQGHQHGIDVDMMQNRSYVLIDIPQNIEHNFEDMVVFGSGSWCGLGMQAAAPPAASDLSDYKSMVDQQYSAVIDLFRGNIRNVYGGSFNEGFTRRTVVNVPSVSTIKVQNLFGGAFGADPLYPCDVYEAQVNYRSASAIVSNNIYGGNNHADRTLYGQVNISVPVYNGYSDSETGERYLAKVFGAGFGSESWSQYTEVNLEKGARVYEVYGGGEQGKVINVPSLLKWVNDDPSLDISMYGYPEDGLDNYLVKTAPSGGKYNTNVYIHKGATVGNYAYGGGLGSKSVPGSGDVLGTTYIALLGGKVAKDLYAAGTTGAVLDGNGVTPEGFTFGTDDTVAAAYRGMTVDGFTASATAYIEGGTARNVYGGGWEGNVGKHEGGLEDSSTGDILGETHVIIGIRKDQATLPDDYGFYKGIPAIERNAYSGGEGGAVFGTANLTVNNGYIGYRYFDAEPEDKSFNYYTDGGGYYQEKINDETFKVDGVYAGDGRLKDCGNIFGGGYDVLSSVDFTNVSIWGGVIRNSAHGGGEIATVGRGSTQEGGTDNAQRTLKGIYKVGKTKVEMFNGHVRRNVFGGGKGYNIYGYGQQGTRYTDGYVFGKTEVQIHGGEVGTKEGVEDGYGNVFGGGDIGFVYSGDYVTGSHEEGTGAPGHYYYKDAEGKLTEDCKVVVSPYLQVKAGGNPVTYGGKTYEAFDYVPTDYLNTLGSKSSNGGVWPAEWSNLITEEGENERGIIIRNGVFGGGNVASNSDTQYANATTIFGNTTATLYDVYHRDFITIGTEHIGGLYGGGNLSLVNGYRELNITNYGTDYYGLATTITLDEYHNLSSRERAYFQLQYQCKADVTFGTDHFEKDNILREADYLKLLEKYGDEVKDAFTPYGFCSIYAGRLLNTIQRAEFCGVYGSRMVLQGAKDRVADVGEDIDYTINRVAELSLNQQRSRRSADTGDDALHGNYFGIYSLVNYLGNLTSDVNFADYYRKDEITQDPTKTYYDFKSESYRNGTPSSGRNNGSSRNQVALASGVFLELTTENSTPDHKDYGYITGVVELDLINVKKEEVGGGFVYAKNEHRVPIFYPNKSNVLLSEYNQSLKNDANVEVRDEAQTFKRFRYADASHNAENDPRWSDANWTETDGAATISQGDAAYETMVWQTSGNFIHPTKRIVDDCYPTNNAYVIGSDNYSEAHYWYVKGEVYIYDQKVSAYTGAANAYSKEVHLPLTITAASHGRLQLLNVKPNLYAYYTEKDGQKVKIGTPDADGKPIDKVWVNNENDSYGLNEVVTWWDWHLMSYKDRQYFVTDTYVNCVPCIIDGREYAAGEYVLSDADFTTFKSNSHTIMNTDGTAFRDDDNNDIGLTYVFRSSNNIGHDTGYVLTFDMNSPDIWNDYYTRVETSSPETDKIRESEYERLLNDASDESARQTIVNTWREGPTFTPLETGIYGQRNIEVGDILTKETVDNYVTNSGTAHVEEAYVAKETVTYNYTYTEKYIDDNETEQSREVTVTKTTNAGTAIPASEYNAIGAQSSFGKAYVCTSTLKLADGIYLGYGELKTGDEIDNLKSLYPALVNDIDEAVTEAYVCSQAGVYGGQQLSKGTNYSALTAWCSLPKEDRIDGDGNDKFQFNYDAFDILSDPDYLQVSADALKVTNPEPATTAATFRSPYADEVGVEYRAVYKAPSANKTYTYPAGTYLDGVTAYPAGELHDGDAISNELFEAAVRNDKVHYTKVNVKAGGEKVYIAKENFIYNGMPYGKGQTVDADVFAGNPSVVEEVSFENNTASAITEYYCFEDYDDKDGNQVSAGRSISETAYALLPNDQQNFVIQGMEPTETTTLYVSSESDIRDVMSKRVYTVVYQYSYYEDDDDGSVKMTNELHVINVHLQLESGAPSIGTLNPPGTVLPSNAVGLKAPEVKPGLYEVLSNGWELFNTEDDAIHHRNGAPFINNSTPVYWYQNQKNYVAFYSKTYLGKTYSNYVPLSVANYHDLDRVMQDKEHHLYVDKANVDRPSKIYIDNRECTSDPAKSELDLLKDFYDLSLQTTVATEGATAGHALLDSHVRGGNNLEFILNSDVSPKAYAAADAEPAGTGWTSIGSGTDGCFAGTLHGDGYTVSGLSNSLFDQLCGEVYNLGVTGSFTGAGIAESGEGYVENCWVATTGTPTEGHHAVFHNPTRTDGDNRGPIQVVNSYYPESNSYTAPASTEHGKATPMPDKAFYNGTVAYNLNGFYLKKRYYDNNTSWKTAANSSAYKYLPSAEDGTLPAEMSTAYYPKDYALYIGQRTDEAASERPYLGYVESRYYDGDYVYAGGRLPENNDIRTRTVTVGDGDAATTKNVYTPIWPDDYLFFGQVLSYGHDTKRTHQSQPAHINKSSGRLATETASANRVNRAPAYFRSAVMGVTHYNPYAVFAAQSKDKTREAYPGMTAIDFTGYQDTDYKFGADDATGVFFPPLLDNDGLTDFLNADLTRNLLVYIPATTDQPADARSLTNAAVNRALIEPVYVETDNNYRTVDRPDNVAHISGHPVVLTAQGFTAQRDHYLVDREDFFAPIGYKFTADSRMWYQREPDNFVDISKGWEAVSLPFTAELVTTQQKGELTHFYQGSTTGHEYWLREYKGKDNSATPQEGIFAALFDNLAANGSDKRVDNTFLWDYYYEGNHNHQDARYDTYQTYYRSPRPNEQYPRLANGTAYLIGFPGKTYYEFDLSGQWGTSTTSPEPPDKLKPQIITFASETGAAILVSSSETATATDGFAFHPNYLNQTFAAGTPDTYTLSADGSKYQKVPAAATGDESPVPDVKVAAFRPYFTSSQNNARTRSVEYIVFNMGDDSFGVNDHDASKDKDGGTLSVYPERKKIVVESSLRYTTEVRIVNPAGITLNTFSIEPGETVETRVNLSGVYIVQTTDGLYNKKLAVK